MRDRVPLPGESTRSRRRRWPPTPPQVSRRLTTPSSSRSGASSRDDLAAVEAVAQRGRPGRAAAPGRKRRLAVCRGSGRAPSSFRGRCPHRVGGTAVCRGAISTGCARCARRADCPVMADESCQGLRDAYELVRAEAADVLNVYVVEAGGLLAASQYSRLRPSWTSRASLAARPRWASGQRPARTWASPCPICPTPASASARCVISGTSSRIRFRSAAATCRPRKVRAWA